MNNSKWFLNGGRGSGRGFRLLCETYENKIADLEKENERLTVSYETLKLHDEEEIGMLKSENAELKSRDCWKSCLYASGKSELIHEILQQQYNFTKAKEIIREFVEWATWQGSNCPSFNSIQDKAEQFLSEVEK